MAGGPTPPHPRPVWFEVTPEGTIPLFTDPDSARVSRLRREPRASIVVAAPVGERERWVAVAGHTTISPDGAHELLSRLAARYWDLDDKSRADELNKMLADKWLLITIEPETVSRFSI